MVMLYFVKFDVRESFVKKIYYDINFNKNLNLKQAIELKLLNILFEIFKIKKLVLSKILKTLILP